ncbi:antibiotic biosynthesis monooxygenase family protein [Photobacterium rosenbergii]|uniref:antibiotic biosynthesis monooxygenase family protein n=1 Tax=Photobacterium rosenbergii TaxID=294936 RepID=UPI001C99DD64|nr:antibiotic biosynthesis monooxygenase family protein [Photobacterium rosenbergii]MBY5946097.1 antibiotic biosynthesis monooxygenase [Photobacterium rosenbergii]
MLSKVIPALLFAFTAAPTSAEVTLINPFHVPESHEQAVLDHWEQARDFLVTQPGYISTSLHRSIQPNSQFHYINIAKWESDSHFKSAIAAMNKTLPPLNIPGVEFYPALYEVIRN